MWYLQICCRWVDQSANWLNAKLVCWRTVRQLRQVFVTPRLYLPSGWTIVVCTIAEVLDIFHHPVVDLRQRKPLVRRTLNSRRDEIRVRSSTPCVAARRWPLYSHAASHRHDKRLITRVVIFETGVPRVAARPWHRWRLFADLHRQTIRWAHGGGVVILHSWQQTGTHFSRKMWKYICNMAHKGDQRWCLKSDIDSISSHKHRLRQLWHATSFERHINHHIE